MTNILEFCQIRENNYANSFLAERDRIFNLGNFRFYVPETFFFVSLHESTILEDIRERGLFAALKRSVTVSDSFQSRFVSYHGHVSRLPNAVQLKRVIAVW